MNNHHRSIFRAAAVQRYIQGRDRAVLPPMIAPRIFGALWVLLILLLASMALAWATTIPIYTTGQAVLIKRPAQFGPSAGDVVVFIIVPAEQQSQLKIGQTVFLDTGPSSQRLQMPIIAIEQQISSPAAIQQRFELPVSAAAAIRQPSAIAIARLDSLPSGLPTAAYIGSHYQVEIEIGSRRVLALMPLIGQFFTA